MLSSAHRTARVARGGGGRLWRLFSKPKLINLFFFIFCHLGILKQRQKLHFPHCLITVLSLLKSRAPLHLAVPSPGLHPLLPWHPSTSSSADLLERCSSLSFRCQVTCHTSEAPVDPELELGTPLSASGTGHIPHPSRCYWRAEQYTSCMQQVLPLRRKG